MSEKTKTAVIGDKDTVLAFKAAGAEIFPVINPQQAREALRRLIKEDYAVILITERAAEGNADIISRTKSAAYPAIIPIPDSGGTTGAGIAGIRKDVEKAIGTDIIFK